MRNFAVFAAAALAAPSVLYASAGDQGGGPRLAYETIRTVAPAHHAGDGGEMHTRARSIEMQSAAFMLRAVMTGASDRAQIPRPGGDGRARFNGMPHMREEARAAAFAAGGRAMMGDEIRARAASPTVSAGYAYALAAGLTAEVDAGALLRGRFGASAFTAGARGDNAYDIFPLVQLSLGLAF